MTAYGPQGIPRGRAGGPGWPRSSTSTPVNADINGFPAQFIIVRANQQIRMPSWASYYRAGATGNGAPGAYSVSQGDGGGGGAFSGTQNIPEKAAPGSLITVRFDPTATVVEVLGYRLSAGHASGRFGGVAAGGAVNFNGGNGGPATNGTGSWGGGGSAASRAGAGNNAAATNTTAGSGADGTPGLGYLNGSAPGGTGYPTGYVRVPQSSPNYPVPNPLFGQPVLLIATAAQACNGGDGGGGGGGTGDTTGYPSLGGAGFAIIEFW